jgi:hypothetical protein
VLLGIGRSGHHEVGGGLLLAGGGAAQREIAQDVDRQRKPLFGERGQRLGRQIRESVPHVAERRLKIELGAAAQRLDLGARQRGHVPGESGRQVAPIRKADRGNGGQRPAADRGMRQVFGDEFLGNFAAGVVARTQAVVDAMHEDDRHRFLPGCASRGS